MAGFDKSRTVSVRPNVRRRPHPPPTVIFNVPGTDFFGRGVRFLEKTR